MIKVRNIISQHLLLIWFLALGLIGVSQLTSSSAGSSSLPAIAAAQSKTVPAGEKAKIKGRIMERGAETFAVRDETGAEVVVLLTDATSVKSHKKGLGLFRRGQEYAVTSLVRGLVVEAEGLGNEKGQLIAEKVRFSEADLKTALTVESRVTQVEEANKKLSGQVAEVEMAAKDARSDAAKANEGVTAANKRIDTTNERISRLDEFDKQAEVTVYFAVNSYLISAEDKAALDALVQKALSGKGYLIEVAGFADSTGDPEKNIMLSQRRADAVTKYLAIIGNIPMRRIITPMGYGASRGAANNDTAEGRKQNRRVEVSLLVSRGASSH